MLRFAPFLKKKKKIDFNYDLNRKVYVNENVDGVIESYPTDLYYFKFITYNVLISVCS